MNWFHLLLGQYGIADEKITLDFRNNFLDPDKAQMTFIHELTHAALGKSTEMGMATQTIFAQVGRFANLNREQKAAVLSSLFDAQVFPQEGFATFMGLVWLARKISKTKAVLYAEDNLTDDYLDRFKKLEYGINLGARYRDLFTGKISFLAMQTNLRADAPKLDLLRSPEVLNKYLAEDDNNPSARLERMNSFIASNNWVLTKPYEEIAVKCGIKYFDPPTKEEVANFMNYVFGLAGIKQTISPEMIADSPDPKSFLGVDQEKLLVTNVNHDLAASSEFILEKDAIEFEAGHADIAVIMPWVPTKNDDLFAKVSSMQPEFGMVLFRRTGEKYTLCLDEKMARQLLTNQLKGKTLVVKPGLFEVRTGEIRLNTVTGVKPDLVFYTEPNELKKYLELEASEVRSAEHVHLGMSQGHPYQGLVVVLNGQATVHAVLAFGNVKISEIVASLKGKTTVMDSSNLLPYSTALNDFMGIMGMPWDIDWVASMIAGDEVKRR